MVHPSHRTPIAPAVAWCDDCGDPDPVVFRNVDGDVHAMCATCFTDEAKKLQHRTLAVPA